jgi:hypothetical protein
LSYTLTLTSSGPLNIPTPIVPSGIVKVGVY